MTNKVGIVGGTGLYNLDGMDNVEQFELDTPFGKPSSPIIKGSISGIEHVFISRHGYGHTITPTEINYHANIYALKSLGVNLCISISAVGSLKEELAPGSVVIPDQLIDRTRLRNNTFFGNGIVAHVQFADPYCPDLRSLVYKTAKKLGDANNIKIHFGGTYICMEGPAFSTRAESHLYRSMDASIIGMTALPEAKLAREAEMSYITLGLVTDYDCWRSNDEDVDIAKILKIIKDNTDFSKKIIKEFSSEVKSFKSAEMCADSLKYAIITHRELWPEPTVNKLHHILKRYL
ncbi:MAG: S-methyl-5'-thioadenosine phosphorylase [Proteobacteria bacterium]|nr:S-methyl-5'-thioadenosine phosphorylase [Pseudomonadota bacterium]